MLKNELDVNLVLLALLALLADLGYPGLVQDYDVPPALTAAQRAGNRARARHRIKVEHAISGAKRLG